MSTIPPGDESPISRTPSPGDAEGGDFTVAQDVGEASRIAAASLDAHPAQVGPYRILETIGRGGFGVVYRAERTQPIQQFVALKMILMGMDTREVLARFDNERQALAVMDHSNIARVFDAGATESGRPYFVMELVQGEPITEFCDKRRLTPVQRLELLIPICQAIQHAHQKGIIHRDIKPSNVLVSEQDGKPFPKIIDFGIAKATQAGLSQRRAFTQLRQMIGTPAYMSPEQANSQKDDIDTRSDIYSLGVLLYELLTGTTPIEEESLLAAAYDQMQSLIREHEPPKPSTRLSAMGATIASVAAVRHVEPRQLNRLVRGELDWIVMRCLEKERSRRYESASALAGDLGRYLRGEAVAAGPPSTVYRAKKFAARHVMPLAVAGVCLIALLLGLSIYIHDIRAEQRKTLSALVESERSRREAKQANENLSAVNGFLVDGILGMAEPENAQGARITVDQAVDNAAAQVQNVGQDHPLIEAAIRNVLARIYDSNGRAQEGLPHAQASLDLRRRLLGDAHLDTCNSAMTLATILDNLGQRDAAEAMYRQAIDNGRRAAPADDEFLLQWILNFAIHLDETGDFDQAENFAREALSGFRRTKGAQSPEALSALNTVSQIQLDQGKSDEADRGFREVLQGRRRSLGELHPDIINSLNQVGESEQRKGNLPEAEALLREALEKSRKVFGADHSHTILLMTNLAVVLRKQAKLSEAAPLYKEALEKSRRVLGEDHPQTIATSLGMSMLLRAQGKLDEAESMLVGTLKIAQRVLGEQHPTTLRAMSRLGELLEEQGKLPQAEPVLAELYREAQKVQGDPIQLAGYISKYGLLLVKMHRYSDAEAPLRLAFERLAASGQEHGEVAQQVLAGLAEAAQANGHASDADSWRAKQASLPQPATVPTSQPDSR